MNVLLHTIKLKHKRFATEVILIRTVKFKIKFTLIVTLINGQIFLNNLFQNFPCRIATILKINSTEL